MKDKVKVIRKSNEVLVKATTFSQSGQPIYMTGGGGNSSRKRGVTENVGSAIGGVAGRGVGVLGTLLGQHRSAGGFLNSALNNWERGRQVGQDVGGKAGRAAAGAVGAGGRAAYDMRGSPTERMNRQFARMSPEQNKGDSRLTWQGKPIVGGKVQVTGDSPREDGTEGTSTSAASNVINAATTESRIPGPGEVKVSSSTNPLEDTTTGNPWTDGMTSEHEADLKNRMNNPRSKQVNVVDSHPVQQKIGTAISNVQSQAVPHGVKADGSDALTLREMGPAAAGAISPLVHSAGAIGELKAGDDTNLEGHFARLNAGAKTGTGGRVNNIGVSSLGSGTSIDNNANRRAATAGGERMDRADFNAAFSNQEDGASMADDEIFQYGEPMDMAFRLLKMMRFYR